MYMKTTYMAATWRENNKITLENKSLRELGDGEILIKVKAAGICGTDLHLIEGKYPGCKAPLVPGHEFAGDVAKIGANVDNALIGKRVGCDSYIGCGKCEFCLRSERHLCKCGTCEIGVNVDGGWAEYVIVPKENIYILPETVTYEEAGAGCILNCPLAAIEKVGVGIGDFVVIIGDGPSSLIMVQLARLKGAIEIMVIGHRDKRLALAKELGADRTVNTRDCDIFEVMKGLQGKPNVIIDAVGKAETLNWALEFSGTGTRIHFFGLPGGPLDGIDMKHFLFKELMLTSSTGNPAYWQTSMKYLSSGLLKVKPIISHKFRLQDINGALDYIHKNSKDIVKAILVFE
jgi:threonine dehydrogenase-like Zn-dependent dehydrogenase